MTPFDFRPSPEPAMPIAAPGVRPEQFKEALARLAGGLAIVSCWQDGRPQGLLVSSITGLSVDPPRFLFCIRREASAHDHLLGAHLCGISILSADDEDEALTFIDPALRQRRFTGPRWRLAAPHPPLLESSLSKTVCLVDSVVDAGTHSIVVVSAQSLSVGGGDPLLSYDRDLRRLRPQ